MKFVTIDGIDKSGKSSIASELFKKTNGLVFIIDRSMCSWHFFNELLERSKNTITYKKEYNSKLKDFRKLIDLSVILEVNEDDWKERCKEHEEPELVGNLPFSEHQKELTRWFDKAKYSNVLRLNTSELTVDECINLILKRIQYANK